MNQNYFVYKLYNSDCNEFYIGSTKNMKSRKANHKSSCNNENSQHHNMRLYEYIRSNGGYSNWSYEILEHIRNSINVYELRNLERKYIEQLKPSLNSDIPNRTSKEYRQDNKEYYKEFNKQYYGNNKDKMLEYQSHYRRDNKVQLLEKRQQYYGINKEQILEKKKQYYLNNKEEINEKRKEKFNCECGGRYTRKDKSKHIKTRKHQNYIN